MGLFFGLAAVKGLKKKKKKMTKKVKGRSITRSRSIGKADSRTVTFGEMIPEEVLLEILARLPANSVMRFKCVSKHWSFLISSRFFSNLFFKLSPPPRRRRLFMFLSDKEYYGDCVLLSHYRYADVTHQLDQDMTLPGMGGYLVNALRGLMCFRAGREVRIYNLTTRQLVNLPEVKSNLLDEADGSFRMWNYFGHDPVHDEYKALSTVWEVSKEEERIVRSVHQVLVLGPGASWRNTRSTTIPPPHRPYSKGISINHVLYYGAWIDRNTCVLMSFDLSSEEFKLIELPFEASIHWHDRRANLMNYRGKVVVFEYSRVMTEYILDLWIVEDAGKSEWSHKAFVFPSGLMPTLGSLGFDELLMQNTTRSGELRLSRGSFVSTGSSLHLIYDLEKNWITGGVVLSPLQYCSRFSGTVSLHTTLWYDVKNIMYLET